MNGPGEASSPAPVRSGLVVGKRPVPAPPESVRDERRRAAREPGRREDRPEPVGVAERAGEPERVDGRARGRGDEERATAPGEPPSRAPPVVRAVQIVSAAGGSAPTLRQHATSVLARRHAIVIGPTPPGTGVMAPATAEADA